MLEAQAGDTVRLRLTNNLPEPTNLHYHGLHVTPEGFGDNVFLEIQTGETIHYEFEIPRWHPASTCWYHPHLHGRTARQLGGGMAGGFLIRGELDRIPEVRAAEEHFLVLKDYGIYGNEVSAGPILTVNGATNPRLAIEEGGLLRLRMLNASIDLYFRMRLEEHPFYLIATDGGAVPDPVGMTELLLAPGERVEVLVRGERPPGSYRLLNYAYQGQTGGMPGMGAADPGAALATIVYEGRAEPARELPGRLADIRPLPAPTLPPRRFELRSRQDPAGFVFQINGRDFDHHRVDTRVTLGAIEDWEVSNADQMDHPLHLHVNSFQVLGPDGPEPAWRDMMNVPGGTSRRFRVHYTDYPGRTVYHCHRVAHGDLGMMGVLEIERPTIVPPRMRGPRG
jgi:FtsP/CotA-like multicopper oxidase with cupredoxin domain